MKTLLLEDKIESFKGCQGSDNSSIYLHEGDYVVKNLITEEDIIKGYHLRHRVFCQELGWVPQSENALEVDDYDNNAVFFGVFNEQKLFAFLRLILPKTPFMLEKEFSSLVGFEHKIRRENDTAEVSRLCVAPEVRNNMISGNFGTNNISMFLYKGVYHWCIRHNIRYLYLVVEHKIYRLLRARGFPCKLVGEPKIMPDRVVAVAAIMDWREFEVLNAARRPRILKWFYSISTSPCPIATATA